MRMMAVWFGLRRESWREKFTAGLSQGRAGWAVDAMLNLFGDGGRKSGALGKSARRVFQGARGTLKKRGERVGDRRNGASKTEVLAILKANHELGPDFDEHAAEQILDLMPSSEPSPLTPEMVSEYLDELPRHERQRLLHKFRRRGQSGATIAPILALSIPLLAIAGNYAGTPGIFAVLTIDGVAIVMSILSQ